MRTTVDLDPRLVREAAAASGARTKKDLLHRGLRELVHRRRVEGLLSMIGKPILKMTPRELFRLRRLG